MTSDLKVDRKVASSQKMVESHGRRCPVCKKEVFFLILWRFWDADTLELLDDFCCCMTCNNQKYRAV